MPVFVLKLNFEFSDRGNGHKKKHSMYKSTNQGLISFTTIRIQKKITIEIQEQRKGLDSASEQLETGITKTAKQWAVKRIHV